MKMRILLLLGAVTLYIAMTDAMTGRTKTRRARIAIGKSVDKFATKFFEAIFGNKTGNHLFSPLNAFIGLTMAYYGATRDTAKNLGSFLRLPQRRPKDGIKSIMEWFTQLKGIEMIFANEIFIYNKFNPMSTFVDEMEETFTSEVQTIDFGNKVDASKIINEWCKKKIKYQTKNVVEPDDIKSDDSFILVNAVHFKTPWEFAFDPKKTTLRPFHPNAKSSKNVWTMYNYGSYRYGELSNFNAKFIEIPYKIHVKYREASMVIILPDEKNGLARLEKILDKLDVDELHNTPEKLSHIYLPKFKIERTIDLEQPLAKLNLGDMFTPAANFPSIAENKRLHIGKVKHRAFIEIDEVGTGPSLKTESVVTLEQRTPQSSDFVVDRPFVCLILMEKIKVLQARVVDPTLN